MHISLLHRSGLDQFRELAGRKHPSHMHVVRDGYGGLTGEAAPRQINTGYSVNGSFAEYAPTDPAYVGHLLPSRHNAAQPLRDRKFADSSVEGDGFELSVPRERGYRPELSSVIYVPENVRFCRTNIRSRPRWRLLSSCTRTPNGRLATGGGRDSLSAALTSHE